MSNDSRDYKTNSIDLAAYLATYGRFPSVVFDRNEDFATFVFRRDDELSVLLEEYLSGVAVAPVMTLFSSRRRLFHEVRRQRGGNHAV